MPQVMQRIEKKYLLDDRQYRRFMNDIHPYIVEDIYPTSSIYNLYLDNHRYDMLYRSMEKPPFKEKLRIRSYQEVTSWEDEVFLEVKRKSDHVVSKRRIAMTYGQCLQFLQQPNRRDSQMQREFSYMLQYYRPQPRIFLAYDRFSYVAKHTPGLRITLDYHIRSRFAYLSLCNHSSDAMLFHKDMMLLEIKAESCYPLWLSQTLSKLQLYPLSFSKVGQVFYKKGKGDATCLSVY